MVCYKILFIFANLLLHFNILTEMSRAEHYKNYKTLLDVETYLSIDISYKYRRVLTNFRCSAHKLMIEKGRHNNYMEGSGSATIK